MKHTRRFILGLAVRQLGRHIRADIAERFRRLLPALVDIWAVICLPVAFLLIPLALWREYQTVKAAPGWLDYVRHEQARNP